MNTMRLVCSLSIILTFGFAAYEHLSKDEWGLHAYVYLLSIVVFVIITLHAILTYEEDDSENDE
ncbi:hypothetical protein [Thaumasiovibrio subtropicus]|uniref:hypothetical protein n=1 Tax=Thaumasiovibrio subtropicus TaxID=1891207 RepID=UPI000B362A42|nr:hypothetical protein [Thaumasiovibrio subtropicus]